MQSWLTGVEQALVQAPLLKSFVIICVVLILEKLIPWPEKFHPLSLFRLVCQNLADKVNPKHKNRTPSQRKLSGLLACGVLLIPTAIIIGILLNLAYYRLFFEAFLLWIALQLYPYRRSFDLVEKALSANKKSLAKNHLRSMVLRDVEPLSKMGVAKGAIESLLLRYNYQVINIIIWFLISGGLGALIVRLLIEMNQCWNTKKTSNQYFGAFCSYFVALLSLPSSVVFCIVFALAQGIQGGLKGLTVLKSKPHSFWSNGILLKAICGGAMGIQLSGPAFYDGLKQRFPRLGGEREIVLADLNRLRQALARVLAISLVGLLLAISVIYVISRG